MQFLNIKQLIYLSIFFITSIVFAQEENQGYFFGGGISNKVESNIYGINSRLYYDVNKHFCFGPEVSYFPKQKIDNNYELSVLDLNINVHYIFGLTHHLGIYPLTGVNYTIEEENSIDNNKFEKENFFGLNYGLGVHYNINKVFIFAEYKGIISKLPDGFITLGVILPLFH